MSRSSPSRTRSPLNAPSPPLPQPPAPASAFRLHESGSSGDRTEVESHGIPSCHRRLYGDSGWAENAELVDVFLEHFKNVTGFSSCVPTGQPSGQCAIMPSFLAAPGTCPVPPVLSGVTRAGPGLAYLSSLQCGSKLLLESMARCPPSFGGNDQPPSVQNYLFPIASPLPRLRMPSNFRRVSRGSRCFQKDLCF